PRSVDRVLPLVAVAVRARGSRSHRRAGDTSTFGTRRMTAFAKLRVARLILSAGIIPRPLLCGAAAGYTLLLRPSLIDIATPVSLDALDRIDVVAVAAVVVVMASLAWRDRSVFSARRVALWVEEQFPSLEYALVTAVETRERRFVAGMSTDRW